MNKMISKAVLTCFLSMGVSLAACADDMDLPPYMQSLSDVKQSDTWAESPKHTHLAAANTVAPSYMLGASTNNSKQKKFRRSPSRSYISNQVPSPANIYTGFYFSAGLGWNTIRNRYSSFVYDPRTIAIDATGYDDYIEWQNKLAPALGIGWFTLFDENWLWGLQAIYKWIGMYTNDTQVFLINAQQALQNSTPYSQTEVDHELLLLGYVGYAFTKSYAYFGVGASMFDVTNSILSEGYNIGVGSFRTAETAKFSVNRILWGWAAQLGYNYYFRPTWMIGVNYTYASTQSKAFNNSPLRTEYYVGDVGATAYDTVILNRRVSVIVQEVMVTISKLF